MTKQERDEILNRRLPDSAVAKRIEEMNAPVKDSKPETEIPAEIIEIAQQMGDDYSQNKEAEFSPRSANAGRECALAMYRKLQADKPRGLPWIKASDRLPPVNTNKWFVARKIKKYDAYGQKALFLLLCYDGRRLDMMQDILDEYEWLDESSPDETASLRATIAQEKKKFDKVANDNLCLEERLIIANERMDAAKALFEMEHDKFRKAQAEIDRVAGEAKAYREALEYIKSELSKKDVTDGGKTIYYPGDSIKMWNIIIIILDKYQPTQKI